MRYQNYTPTILIPVKSATTWDNNMCTIYDIQCTLGHFIMGIYFGNHGNQFSRQKWLPWQPKCEINKGQSMLYPPTKFGSNTPKSDQMA